jgi:hypothetical protein
MGLESATYIDDLVITNPAGADDRATADDHLRLVKSVLKTTFPTINGAVTASLAEINKLDGLTASQTELNQLTSRTLASNDDVIDNFEAGILALFQQSAAPTGWTKQITHNNKALRIVSGTASSGGTTAFTTLLNSTTSSEGHTLVEAEIPAHTHNVLWATSTAGAGFHHSTALDGATNNVTYPTDETGGDGSHAHDIIMDLQYVDVIIASKD